MPQNTFTTFRKSPNSYNRAQTPSNEEVDTQFSTQIGLENITIEEGGRSSTEKKMAYEYSFQLKRINFSLVRDLMFHSIQLSVMVKN